MSTESSYVVLAARTSERIWRNVLPLENATCIPSVACIVAYWVTVGLKTPAPPDGVMISQPGIATVPEVALVNPPSAKAGISNEGLVTAIGVVTWLSLRIDPA